MSNRKFLTLFLVFCLMLPVGSTFSIAKTDVKEKKQMTAQERLVKNMGEEAIKKLAGKKITDKQREAHMRALLDRYFDITAIGRFALGRNWRKADKKQQKEYLKLFKDMVVSTYASRFREYSGEKFEVIGSKTLSKRDVMVNSKIIPKEGPELAIDWRVRKKSSKKYKVIDIIIEGVSMGVTQRSEFASIIQHGGGKIDSLLDELRNK